MRLVVQQRAEVDPPVRIVAVQRLVDLARALAADQRPVRRLGRPGVEEVHPRRSPAPRIGTGTVVARRRSPARAGRSPRSRARSAAGPRRTRAPSAPCPRASAGPVGRPPRPGSAPARVIDEVHVLKAPLDDRDAAVRWPTRASCVALPVSTSGRARTRSRPARRAARVLDADEDLVAVLALELDQRPLVPARGDDELRPPVHPPLLDAVQHARRATRSPARSPRDTAER